MSFPKPVQYKRRLDEKILFCSIVVLFNSTSLILRLDDSTHTAGAKKHNMQICSVCLAPFGEAYENAGRGAFYYINIARISRECDTVNRRTQIKSLAKINHKIEF